jgi:transposase
MMRFYKRQHKFYCGIDLHARSIYVCILDADGVKVLHKGIAADPRAFLKALAPYRDDLVVGVECMFAWYWIADLCTQEKINIVLGHALYMKAIHGGKAKNDRIDSSKIADLLRGGNFPLAYVYPKGMRETRDLLRRRCYYVRHRAELFAHIQNTNSQYNLAAFGKKLSVPGQREELDIAARFTDPSVRKSIEADLAMIEHLDEKILNLESYLGKTAQVDDLKALDCLQSIPGVGKILSLVFLYEIHDIKRFPTVGQFLSYARLVRCLHESAGKIKGSGGSKIGNPQLKWAFLEAACLFLCHHEPAKKWKQKHERKYGKKKALSILAARLARLIYHMLRKGEKFDEGKFWARGNAGRG